MTRRGQQKIPHRLPMPGIQRNPSRWVVALALLIGSLALLQFGWHPPSREWGVLLATLPEEIATSRITNSVYYVLKQTHEPVFRKDDGQHFSSRILKDWTRSLDSSRFVFCPETTVSFDPGHPLTPSFFLEHISRVTKRYDPDARVSSAGECAEVAFKVSRAGYLDFLTSYENAPSLKRTDNIEDGLGPYRLDTLDKSRITLLRKHRVKRGYDKIVLYGYAGKDDPRLADRNIKDFNRIGSFEVPEWVKRDYYSFDNLKLKSEILIINVPDKDTRDALYNCIDVDRFRRAFLPRKTDFHNIKTVLPLGVPGARKGLPEQRCEPKRLALAARRPLVFANWRDDNQRELHDFFEDFNRATGISVKVMDFEPSTLAALLHKKPRVYHLLVIMMGIMKSEHEDFLGAFFGSSSYLDFEPAGPAGVHRSLLHENDEARRSLLARDVADGLATSHAVLTLYQGNESMYYPKEIRNFTVGNEFMEDPEVANFRW